jgi:transglutaminase-like putative cysteine protease
MKGCLGCAVGLVLALWWIPARGEAAYDVWSRPARYKLEYRVDAGQLAHTKAERVRIWLPYPAETDDQQVLSAAIASPWSYQINRGALGNRMVYLEGTGPPASDIVMSFEVERRPTAGVPRSQVTAGGPLDPARYAKANTLIPLDGIIRQIAAEQSRGIEGQGAKARAFYDYVVRTMRYDKDGTGWGRGDAVWACANKRGNCTDFHSLFIGMARSQGIPARFLIGVPIPAGGERGNIAGYHCWAEYFDAARGWIPIDASEAKKSGWVDAYFGWLPSDRIEFTAGRDLTLTPAQQGPPLNYFIFPYVEADGVPVGEVKATFQFERLPLSVTSGIAPCREGPAEAASCGAMRGARLDTSAESSTRSPARSG